MKTPGFWQSRNLISTLLLPFSWLYGMGGAAHRACSLPKKLSVPVICIGNLTAGGAGKTPVALALGEHIKRKNIRAFFLSRGYGSTDCGCAPIVVDAQKHTALEVGDEPLLLARVLPTVVARNRLKGAQLAIAQGAQLIIMDDGFQNHQLYKNLSLLVIDNTQRFGNERLMPAGPLREGLMGGFKRADAVVLVNASDEVSFIPVVKPVLHATTRPGPKSLALCGKKLLAFCGLAVPQKFFTMLESFGAIVVGRAVFADHHRYSTSELEQLLQQAATLGAQLVTTEKDAVRLPENFRANVAVADMELAFTSTAVLDALLEPVIAA